MLKKSIPILSIIAAVVLLLITAKALTNLPVPPMAKDGGQMTESEAILMADTIQGQKQVVIDYIESANSVSAQAAFDILLTNFVNSDLFVPTIYELGEKFREKGQFESAISAHKYIVDNFPSNTLAMEAQKWLAASYIGSGDLDSAQIETQKLIDNYINAPGIAQAVFEVADTYYWFGKNDRARPLYQMVIDTWPEAQHCLWSQMGIAISHIADGNDIAAQKSIDALILTYPDNVKLPEALFYIAGRYSWDEKFEQAKRIYQIIIKDYPASSWAGRAEIELAKTNMFSLVNSSQEPNAVAATKKLINDIFSFIDSKDEPNAMAEIDKFINTYRDKPELSAFVYDFGARADWINGFEPNNLTKRIYNKVIEEFPQSPQVINSRMSLSRMSITGFIDSNDDPNAFAAIDNLINDFNNCPDLPMAVSLIGENYYAKGLRMQNEGLKTLAAENYEKSIIVREIIIQQLPFSELTPRAYYFAGVLYSHYLEQYQKGIEYFQKVVDNWPDYQFAWNAQFFIGFYYEILRNSGSISESEANPKIEEAYQAVVEKYPYSEPAGHVALKLGWMYFKEEQWHQAIKYFEFFIDKFPDQLGTVVWPLGQSYEKTGQTETAIDFYRAFIELSDPCDPQVKTVKARLETFAVRHLSEEGQNK